MPGLAKLMVAAGARGWLKVAGIPALLCLVIATAPATPMQEPTVAELKARIPSADTAHKSHLCLQIAERELIETDKFYAAVEVDKAQAALTDVVAYSEMARDYAIQSHKYQKQTEIAVRVMARRLNELLHTISQQDQGTVRDAVHRLERVRDDLLVSMFPKGAR